MEGPDPLGEVLESEEDSGDPTPSAAWPSEPSGAEPSPSRSEKKVAGSDEASGASLAHCLSPPAREQVLGGASGRGLL